MKYRSYLFGTWELGLLLLFFNNLVTGPTRVNVRNVGEIFCGSFQTGVDVALFSYPIDLIHQFI
jgi:hypothetical protein